MVKLIRGDDRHHHHAAVVMTADFVVWSKILVEVTVNRVCTTAPSEHSCQHTIKQLNRLKSAKKSGRKLNLISTYASIDIVDPSN